MHHGLNRRCIMVFVAMWLAQPALAEPPESPEQQLPAEALDIDALVREAETLIDVILEHHINPPVRQALWFAGTVRMVNPHRFEAGPHRFEPGARLVADDFQFSAVVGMKIRGMTASEELGEFLKELWSNDIIPKTCFSAAELKQAFIHGMLGAVPGGASVVQRTELKAQEQLRGNRYIGTGIASNYDDKRGYFSIGMVLPNGPMARAGGRKGDLVLKIDGRDMHRMPMGQVNELLRGEEGTKVTLELCAPDQFQSEVRPGVPGAPPGSDGAEYENRSRTIVVTRGPVVLETIEGIEKAGDRWDYNVDSGLHIRYVKIGSINGSTVHDLRQLERQFRAEGARAIILDFRNSRAADLHYTVLLADALMDGSQIGRLRMKDHSREFYADRDCLFRDLPLAILIDQQTYGGAEWIAAALQDSGQAILIGENSAGHAFVETTVVLPGSGDGLRLATGIFERPSGKPFQGPSRWRDKSKHADETAANAAGIRPDKIVRSTRAGDGKSNVVTVVGEQIFRGGRDLDPIQAAAVRELAIHGRARRVAQ